MHYLGGKFKIRKEVAAVIEKYRGRNQKYYEPFCGGLWVTICVRGIRHVSDVNKPLITLYKEMKKGWLPPDFVTRELYDKYRANRDPDDPLTAFLGFGCSWSGMYFNSFIAEGKNRHYSKAAKTGLLAKIAKCSNVTFEHRSYTDLDVSNSIIYCDPPYEGVTGYKGVGAFNTDEFWDVVRYWENKGNTVIVSEYNAPKDFQTVAQFETSTCLHEKEKTVRIEKLFMLKNSRG